MRGVRLGVVIGLLGFGIAIGYITGQQGAQAASSGLTAQDYADIQQLYWRYNHGSDFRDAELFLSVFTDDAVFEIGDQKVVGREELQAQRVERHAGQVGDTGTRHWNTSYLITQSSEGAEGRLYWQLNGVAEGQPRPVASGTYDDVYVKTSDGWRIKHRIINFDAGAPPAVR